MPAVRAPWLGGYLFEVGGSDGPALVKTIAAAVASSALLWLAGPRQARLVAGQVARMGN